LIDVTDLNEALNGLDSDSDDNNNDYYYITGDEVDGTE
jgi:hypothetical protein